MPTRIAKGKDKKRLERLQKTVTYALKALEQYIKSEYYAETKSYLLKLETDSTKFGELINGERPPSVGVFGVPSRGKSTLLNVLLGVDILPMQGKQGTTRFGTELSYKEPEPESIEQYEIKVEYEKKPPRLLHLVLEDVKDELKILSDEAKSENQDTSRIIVKGPFRSYIGDDIIFVDTPGALPDASKGKDELKDHPALYHDWEADFGRALAVLDEVDIVIFCMRFKYVERSDKDFYDGYIRKKYDPINVITASDMREGRTNQEIKKIVKKDYELLLKGDTVVVSSTEALKKINDPKNEDKDINKLVKSKFKKDDNLKEFLDLKNLILRKAGNRDSADIRLKISRFEDAYNVLREDAVKKGIELPELGKVPKRSESPKPSEALKPSEAPIPGKPASAGKKIAMVVRNILIAALVLIIIALVVFVVSIFL